MSLASQGLAPPKGCGSFGFAQDDKFVGIPLPYEPLYVDTSLVTSASAAAWTAATAASIPSASLRLIAALAEHRTVAARLERHGCLLSTTCANYRCPLRLHRAVSATAALLLILFCLAARLASLRRRVAALAEKGLIISCKNKFLSAIAARELHIPSHVGSLAFRFRLESSCAYCPGLSQYELGT
jgi:hypothetical protein